MPIIFALNFKILTTNLKFLRPLDLPHQFHLPLGHRQLRHLCLEILDVVLEILGQGRKDGGGQGVGVSGVLGREALSEGFLFCFGFFACH